MPQAEFQLFSTFPQEALDVAIVAERAGRLITAARRGLSAAQGLTLASWRLLKVIDRSNGRTSFARLARRLRVSRQAVREMGRELCSRGWVKTTRGSVNRKEMQLVLTPKSGLALAELDETLRTLLLEMTSGLSREELTAAARVLNYLSGRLRRCETILRR